MGKLTERVKIQGRHGPIEIEFVDEPISPHGGVSLLKAGLFKTKMLEDIDLGLSVKQRDRGFSEAEYLEALILLLALGGDRLDDLAMLREDDVIGELIPTPSAQAMGEFLQKMYLPHINVLKKALARGVKATWKAASHELSSLTLDIDSSIIEMAGHQQGVRRCYEGTMGYHPIFAFLAELEVPANAMLRSGNTFSGAKAAAFLEETRRRFPDLPIANLRADSAFYNKDVVAWCERNGLGFTITADQTGPLMDCIAAILEQAWLRRDEIFEVAEFRYRPTGWTKDYRFVATRKRTRSSLQQPSLFASHDYTYHVFVTNRSGCKTSLVSIHHGRATCENLIKELKDGFAGNNMPSHQFMGNAAWLLAASMAMTLQAYLRWSGLSLAERPLRAKRFRFRFLQKACRLIRHAGQWILRIVVPIRHRLMFQRMLLAPA